MFLFRVMLNFDELKLLSLGEDWVELLCFGEGGDMGGDLVVSDIFFLE